MPAGCILDPLVTLVAWIGPPCSWPKLDWYLLLLGLEVWFSSLFLGICFLVVRLQHLFLFCSFLYHLFCIFSCSWWRWRPDRSARNSPQIASEHTSSRRRTTRSIQHTELTSNGCKHFDASWCVRIPANRRRRRRRRRHLHRHRQPEGLPQVAPAVPGCAPPRDLRRGHRRRRRTRPWRRRGPPQRCRERPVNAGLRGGLPSRRPKAARNRGRCCSCCRGELGRGRRCGAGGAESGAEVEAHGEEERLPARPPCLREEARGGRCPPRARARRQSSSTKKREALRLGWAHRIGLSCFQKLREPSALCSLCLIMAVSILCISCRFDAVVLCPVSSCCDGLVQFQFQSRFDVIIMDW